MDFHMYWMISWSSSPLKITSYPGFGCLWLLKIEAYFSTPTTRQQKIKITSAKIKSYNTDITPAIDQRYVQFKTIEMKNCCYVSKRKFSHKAITEWLGEKISVLNVDNEKEVDSVTFKIRKRAPGILNHKKRKHSEIDNEKPSQKL